MTAPTSFFKNPAEMAARDRGITSMTAPYEEIAATRPRIRRDVLFTETPTGVLFHNAHGGFSLNAKSAYRFASIIVPHLNGEHPVEALCAGLGPTQRDMVVELVRTLYDRGFARAVAPGDDRADTLPPEVARRFAPRSTTSTTTSVRHPTASSASGRPRSRSWATTPSPTGAR
jgi:hypothetical protein